MHDIESRRTFRSHAQLNRTLFPPKTFVERLTMVQPLERSHPTHMHETTWHNLGIEKENKAQTIKCLEHNNTLSQVGDQATVHEHRSGLMPGERPTKRSLRLRQHVRGTIHQTAARSLKKRGVVIGTTIVDQKRRDRVCRKCVCASIEWCTLSVEGVMNGT